MVVSIYKLGIERRISPFATHEHSNGPTFANVKAHYTCCNSAANKLAQKRNCNDQKGVTPRSTVIQESKVGLETREREIL
jgi:hypothetical protein